VWTSRAKEPFPIRYFSRESVKTPASAGAAVEKEPSWKAKRAMFLFASVWTALVILTPFTVGPGSLDDLSGSVGTIDNDFDDLNIVAKIVYLIGDLNCHTKVERSLELNGNQMAFCARDVGLFLGLSVGMAAVIVLEPRFRWILVIAMAAPIVIDGTAQLLFDYESNYIFRIITGAMGGSAAALFLGHVADSVLRIR
jgi:uncharacterized membrane protein